MEVLLGGLLGSDDPRAQTLLGELIGAFPSTLIRTHELTQEHTRQATRKRATFSRAT